MSQQRSIQSTQSQFGAQELALRALTAIDQKAIRPFADKRYRQASFGRRHRGGSPKKYQLEHDRCRPTVISSARRRL